jgi:Cu(I)/Ag(I) efflux system membrane fusion protein
MRSNDSETRATDEGGLHAPPDLHGWRKAWWWFDFVVLVNLARLRFIAILAVIGIVITQWDTLTAYYDKWTRPAVAAEQPKSKVEYFCPMHPTVVTNNPNEKCPICFMPLSKRAKGQQDQKPLPAGVVNRVQLTPYRVALAGAQTAPVEFQALSKEITAVGYVEFDERAQRTVSARVDGRIDRLIANETGQTVNAGDPLAELYSPDLLVTVQSLLDAKRSGNAEFLNSSRIRLQRLGIDSAQIDEILKSSQQPTHLTIRSPITGHVIKKYVREGQYVREGTPLYEVADLSTVWIQAQVYEDDLVFLPVNAMGVPAPQFGSLVTVKATTRAFPNQPFYGTLAFVYPHVDQETRSVTVRFELNNPEHKLRPGGTATLSLRVAAQQLAVLWTAVGDDPAKRDMLQQSRVLAIPESAVIDTGRQKIVYREASQGVFEGVLVELGPRMTTPEGVLFFPVLHGLEQGDRVVVAGSFLVDAETRLNPAAGSIYFGGSSGSKSAAASTVRPSTPAEAAPTNSSAAKEEEIAAELAKLSPEDQELAKAQRFCPIQPDNRIGAMGPPVKVMVDGQPVFLCCEGCKEEALGNPKSTLERVEKLKAAK